MRCSHCRRHLQRAKVALAALPRTWPAIAPVDSCRAGWASSRNKCFNCKHDCGADGRRCRIEQLGDGRPDLLFGELWRPQHVSAIAAPATRVYGSGDSVVWRSEKARLKFLTRFSITRSNCDYHEFGVLAQGNLPDTTTVASAAASSADDGLPNLATGGYWGHSLKDCCGCIASNRCHRRSYRTYLVF